MDDKKLPPALPSNHPEQNMDYDMRVLTALRRIIRAVDIYSHRLHAAARITTPQLLCLLTLVQRGPMNLKSLAAAVSLGPSTVIGIVDRLEARGLVRRQRSGTDRRHVFVDATAAGTELAASAPPPLQDRLAAALGRLSRPEQAAVAATLENIVAMMGAGHLEASPILDPREDIRRERRELPQPGPLHPKESK